jgi:hypothetical protein
MQQRAATLLQTGLSDHGNHGDGDHDQHDGGPDDQVIAIDGRYPSHDDLPFGLQTLRQGIGSTVT